MDSQNPIDKHPSGLSWEKWNWPPLQTPADQKLVKQYYDKQRRQETTKVLSELEEAPF